MQIPIRTLLLSMQVALLGGVTPRLRAVTVGYRQQDVLFLTYYYEGFITDDDHEFVSCAETELVADYWQEDNPIQIEGSAVRIDYPQPIPWQDIPIYHRYESNFQLSREPFPYSRLNSLQLDLYNAMLIMLRVLLGNVTPDLRRVFVVPEMQSIKLYFYYQGMIPELSRELAHKAANFLAEQVDDGNSPELVELHLERLDYPARPPIERWCVYSRYEPLPPEELQ